MNFAEVERMVAKLRQDLAAGRLTEEQFKAQLRGMMVEDEAGNWWMVGYETGQWYRHDGTDWVLDQPPGYTPSVATQPSALPGGAPPRPASQPPVSRLNFWWRGLGLTLLGVVLYGGGNWVMIMLVLSGLELPVWPPEFIPSLFGVLFGPWVGGFAGALGSLVSHVLTGRLRPVSWGGALALFALGMLPGLIVKDARNWKAVLGAGVVAGLVYSLVTAATYGIVHGNWGVIGSALSAVLPLNILLLPLLARWLVGPVRRWGLYWRDRC